MVKDMTDRGYTKLGNGYRIRTITAYRSRYVGILKGLKVIVSGPNEQLDVDLEDIQSLSKDNDGIKYLLVAIDVFSRYAWVEPLKNKTAKEVEGGLMIILNQAKPRKIRTDGGSEFNNRWLKSLLENKHFYHHVTMNETKANYVESYCS
jgi:hypothetical protein